ncbi:hypothetical protein DERF_013803 [Dermatophagoides farinae]|uniref:Negative elongation factor B n=1 Tax=Dermatophagoides farinae TaxID=6954 RepID=A0A922KZ39_DERFA|nr:hypothetical protein DERF_013803 [Dermatophagoides farinae]
MDDVTFIQDLEEIGIHGRSTLRDILTDSFRKNSNDDQQHDNNNNKLWPEILEFQSNNGIILPSLQPMFPLLHLLGVKSFEFHKSVVEELRENLINRFEEISQKMDPNKREANLKALLAKSFPLIKMPMIQPVVMALLKNIEVVEDKYLKLLVADESLYKKCDVSVKRHIWQEHQSMLVGELSPILSEYVKEKEAIFANIKESKHIFFLLTPKQRRQNEILQSLAQMVGKNVLLYDTILQFVRTVFIHTKNPHYCTLRVSLLMELHDANITDITSMDACHKFAWCLDACIRENTVDHKRIRELQGFLDNVKKGQEAVFSDLAMALYDPYAVNFLVQTAMRILNSLITNESCPREHQTLQFLLRLLNLGLHAHEILKTQAFREPKLNPEILTRFLPIIMGFMVDDQVRSVNSKLPPDDRESALTIIEHSGPPPDCFQTFIQQDPLAAIFAIYYTAQAARQHDRQAVVRVLGSLTTTSTYNNLSHSDPYQHILVSALVQLADEFVHDDLCTLVFDEILLPALDMNSTAVHLMKLIYHLNQWIPQERLESLMMKLQHYVQMPSTKDQRTRTTFVELVQYLEKIKEEKLRKNQPPQLPTTPVANQSNQIIAGNNTNVVDSPIGGSASVRIASTTTTTPQHHPMMTPSPHVYHTPSHSHHHHPLPPHSPVPPPTLPPPQPSSPLSPTPYYSTQQQPPMSPYTDTTNNPLSPYSGQPMSPLPPPTSSYQSPFHQPSSSSSRSTSSSSDRSYPTTNY